MDYNSAQRMFERSRDESELHRLTTADTRRFTDRWRVVILVIVWAVSLFAIVAEIQPQESRHALQGGSRLFSGWDSNWYVGIATSGYEWKNDGLMHNTAFFPLYPLLIRFVTRVTGIEPHMAGEALSFLSLLVAALLLVPLTRGEGFEPLATVRAMLLFPMAFFFLCVYAESLFLLLTAACLLASSRQRTAATFVFGALAALTRVNGVLLIVPLLWSWWVTDRRIARLIASCGPAAGLLTLCVFDGLKFGRPLAWLTVQQTGWNHTLVWPWQAFARGLMWHPRAYFSVAAALAFSGLTLLLWRKQRSYALWLAANLALFLSSGSMLSTGRYLAPLFPAFWLIGRSMGRSRFLEVAYDAGGAIGLVYSAVRFSHGLWVG